ncbi:flagellar basal-body rod modification protein FlgD [Tropicimonas sediminicola]|uniref:Basal-body rod modification protein FlgD n=2 Tax=Tropicimonas sediminicola TaxID=1031541 RepID=A0A239JBC5_9RHOB|nr:flagellar hook capping FlgD N-terminal domain-containing protein [Tropicimonas sediminicola]SNT03177.1 flagellar basal-body rod modification protein FlgD [Tropicimonas sediminicola]
MDAVSSSSSATTSTTSTSSSGNLTSAVSSDFETFLKMLTVQLQNQDPLNPLDSNDYAVQLATFSGVEQQVRTNDLLSSMLEQSTSEDMARMGEWVGQTVRVEADAFFEGNPITVAPAPVNGADHAELVIRDAYGLERNRFTISLDGAPVEWSGIDSRGATVGWGSYSFQVESYDANDTLMARSDAEIYAEVVEARTDGTSVSLVLSGGTEVASSQVTAIRASY